MSSSQAKHATYQRVDVETSSQGKLIVMLFNGAIKRAEEARRQMGTGNNQSVHNNLLRAQDILGELRAALNMKAGPIAENLDRLYEYFQHLLIRANVKKEHEPIDECVALMSDLRDTWQDVFDNLHREQPSKQAPAIEPHGASVLNIEG